MTGPRPVFDREAARRDGHSDAEINAEIARVQGASDPYKPGPSPRIAADGARVSTGVPERGVDNPYGGVGDYAAGVARAGVNGAAFGWGDEGEARIRSLLGGGEYTALRDDIRAKNSAFASENPATSLAANLAGGIATGMGVGTLAKGAGSVAKAAKFFTPGDKAANMAGRAFQAGKLGAKYGAVAGGGAADEISDIPQSAGIGLALGAGFGGLTSMAADGVGVARNAVASAFAPGRIQSLLRAQSPEEAGARTLLGRLQGQGKTLDQFGEDVAKLDKSDVLGEALGLRGLRDIRTDRMLGTNAPDKIEKALDARARNAVGRVQDAAETAFGKPIDTKQLGADKLLEAQSASKPLYEQALKSVTVNDPKVQRLLQTDALGKAYKEVTEMASNDGRSIPSLREMLGGRPPAIAGTDPIHLPASQPPKIDEDALYGMTPEQMRPHLRSATSLEKLTDSELAVEQHYMSQMQGADIQKSAVRESLPFHNYRELRSSGDKEDAAGVLREMGYHDPVEFNQFVARDAGLAERNAAARAPRMAAVEKEIERRRGLYGEAPPDASSSYEPRTIPGVGDMTVPAPHEAPSLPTMKGDDVQRLKLAAAERMTHLEGLSGGTKTVEYAQLTKLKNEVDNLLYEHGNNAPDGSSLWGQGNKAYAKPMGELDAFHTGQKEAPNIRNAETLQRLLAGENPEWVARGAGNTVHDALALLGNSGRNPAPTVMGSDFAKYRTALATGGDAQKQRALEDVATTVERQLKNNNFIRGGSQTTDKAVDVAEAQGLDLGHAAKDMLHPKRAIMNLLAGQATSAGRALIGPTRDAMSELTMAGSLGHMSKESAMEVLRKMEPGIRAQIVRQIQARGQIGGQIGGAASQFFMSPAEGAVLPPAP